MRSTDEQLSEITKRADKIEERLKTRKATAIYTISSLGCIALMIVVFFNISSLSQTGELQKQAHYGSLLLSTSSMGYIVVCVLAFLLGIFITLLCLRLRSQRKKEREQK